MQLVITEKKSVGEHIANVLGCTRCKDGYIEGDKYIVSWCQGHLAELADAASYDDRYGKWNHSDLPIIPKEWKLAVIPAKQKQFRVLRELMKDSRVDCLVNACDAAREGELIFRYVYQLAGCRKPFRRLWISSVEDAAIRAGFENLKDGTEYDNLYAAARCRSRADWLLGINATRTFSLRFGPLLNVGRVLSPTLAMTVERQQAIQSFQPQDYFHTRIIGDGLEAVSEKIQSKDEAEQMQEACRNRQAVVASLKREEKSIGPPKLYDMTTLQREANRYFSFTAQQTLDAAQRLYEMKLATYPRTDSRYLTADQEQTAEAVAAMVLEKLPFLNGYRQTADATKVINDSKVGDHHAIIPTIEMKDLDLGSIPETERKVLLLIATRLLVATGAAHRYESVTATLECAGYCFSAKGKTTLEVGWKEVDRRFRDSLGNKEAAEQGEQDSWKPLSPLSEGQVLEQVDATVTQHRTQPPKLYTEDTLLAAMETAGNEDIDIPEDAEKLGLGTPATRAEAIEKMVRCGFVKREKRNLVPTGNGVALVSVLPETLKSPKYTAGWENALTRIAKGEQDENAFLQEIKEYVSELAKDHPPASPEERAAFPYVDPRRGEPVGICPRCGGQVLEIKKGFCCDNRECRFVMWKDDKFFTSRNKPLNKSMAAALLVDGKVLVRGLLNPKTGKSSDITVSLQDTGQYVNYRLEYPKKQR